MSRLATEAELGKLGVTLGLEREALAFLEDVPAAHLRAIRIAIYELLFDQDRAMFQRLAAIGGRLPLAVNAVLAQQVLGPALTARTAAELRSTFPFGEMVARMPVAFSADVCAHLDPRRTRDLIKQLQPDAVVAIALELARREDYNTMSRFVDFLSDEAIRAVVEALEDERVVLLVAFYMGSKNRIDHLVRMLPPQRLHALIARVAEEPERLAAPFLSLLVHVSYGFKRELGDLTAAEQGEDVLSVFVRAAQEHGLWADLLPVVAAMSPEAQSKVVNLEILSEPAVQQGVIDAADAQGLWGIVLPLVALMDDRNRHAVSAIVAAKPPTTLERAATAALLGEQWPALVDLVRRMPPAKQTEFAAVVETFGTVDPELARRVLRLSLDPPVIVDASRSGAESGGFGGESAG